MIKELLEVPLWCLEYVMTRTEAEHILAICVIGKQLQSLLTLTRANIRCCRTVAQAVQSAAARQHNLPRTTHALIPVSEATVASLTHSRQQLLTAISDCLEKLQSQKPSLELFISQHSFTADELENAGCLREAARRRFLVAIESQMLHNISVILREATAIATSSPPIYHNPVQGIATTPSHETSTLQEAVPLRNHCKDVWSQLFDAFDEAPPLTTAVAAPAAGTNSSGSDDHSTSHLLLPLDRLAQSVRRPASRQSNMTHTPRTPLVRAYVFDSSSSSAAGTGPSDQTSWTNSSDARTFTAVNDSQSTTPQRLQQIELTADASDRRGSVGYESDHGLSGTQPNTKRPRNDGVTLSELFERTPAATPRTLESQASDHTVINDTQYNEQLRTLTAGDDEAQTQPDVDDGAQLLQSTMATHSKSQTTDPPLTASDTSSQGFVASLQTHFLSQPRPVDNQSSSLFSKKVARMNTL